MSALLGVLFSLVVGVICVDGIILLVSPTTNAVIVNRWNALTHDPHRMSIETYKRVTWMWRLTGLAMTTTCVYVLFKILAFDLVLTSGNNCPPERSEGPAIH